MQSQGASRDEIWRETGWFQGDADGKWRFEIDDSKANFRDFDKLKDNPTRAGDAFDHDELYKAYPELRDDVTFGSGKMKSRIQGIHNPKNKAITINARAQDPRSTALHELQHSVQRIEGYARGGSLKAAREIKRLAHDELRAVYRSLVEVADDVRKMQTRGDRAGLNRLRAKQHELVKRKNSLERISEAEPEEIYKNIAGEVEARKVENRRNFTPERRRVKPPWRTEG